MNKTIRKCAVCSVLTVAVATGWGKPADRAVGSPHKTPSSAAIAPKKSAPAAAAPKGTPKPITTAATKSTTEPVAKPAPSPVAKPMPKAVASTAPALTATQKALRVLDGGAVDDTDNGLKYQADGKRLVSCDPKAVSVTIKKEVELIHGNAFRGCTALLRMHFLGDAPNAAEEVFADIPRGCTIYVEKGSKGWPKGIPCVWKGVGVRYSDEIKNMPMTLDGQITLAGIGYRVRSCGDGVALSADPKGISALAVETLVVPEKIGNAPVRILGDSVFPDCTNVAKVVIPASVTNFGLAAFSRCNRPRQIEIGAGNPEYRIEGGLLYEQSTKTVIMAGKDVSAVKIPVDALKIGPKAFKGCESLTAVEISATLNAIGESAFAGCMGLSVVTVPVDADIAPDAFENCCATIRKVGTYCHYDGFAGKSSEMRWIPEDIVAEGPFSDPLPLREAVERAGKNDGVALYSLAIHCAKGGDVNRDPERAMEYLLKAVSAKDANAEFLLALIVESRMAGSDLNDSSAPGIAGRLGLSAEAATTSEAVTPFEKYVGVLPSAFADSRKTASASIGSLANEKDYELLRDVYEAASRDGCPAAGVRLEHLSYLSKMEFERVEKKVYQRLVDGLKAGNMPAADGEYLP